MRDNSETVGAFGLRRAWADTAAGIGTAQATNTARMMAYNWTADLVGVVGWWFRRDPVQDPRRDKQGRCQRAPPHSSAATELP